MEYLNLLLHSIRQTQSAPAITSQDLPEPLEDDLDSPQSSPSLNAEEMRCKFSQLFKTLGDHPFSAWCDDTSPPMAPMATISEVIIEESEEEPHMGPRRQVHCNCPSRETSWSAESSSGEIRVMGSDILIMSTSPSIESTDDTDSVVAVYSTANRLDTTESTGLDIDDEFREDIDNSFFDYSLDEYMGILISMKPFRHQSSPSASSEPDDTVFETAIQEPIDEMSPVDTESRTSEARENQDETKERASRENNNSGDTCPLPSTPSTITRSDEEEGPKTPRTCIVCGVPSLMDFCGYCWRHFKTNLRPPRPKPRWKTVQQRKSWRRRKTTATCGPSNRDQDDAQRTAQGQTSKACASCGSEPACMLLIHGRTAHQVLCHACSRRLLQQREPRCPACQRRVNRAVKNYKISY